MALSDELISAFVEVTTDKTETKQETTVYGTIIEHDGTKYVQLDGSDMYTPFTTTSSVKVGDRVMVHIKNHTATITGNTSDPSASTETVKHQGDQITEFEHIVAYKVTTEDLEATNAYIEELRAELAKIDKLEVVQAEIDELEARLINVDYLTATDMEVVNAKIENLQATVGSFTDVSTENLQAINAEIGNLKAYTGTFTYLSTEVLEAIKAEIRDLNVDNLDAKYANIDFANIGEAAIKKIFADSGLIRDLVVGDSTITGELVGVTIKGDLIEANTLKADKLVVKGSDGIYYKLNFEAGTFTGGEEVPDDSLHGSIITAKSITAEKVSVKDLVAFGATIGGFHIADHSLYSSVKESVNNTTRGVYLDDEGQVAFGDSNNYLKYFKDTDGKYKLIISAGSIVFSSSGKSVEEAIEDATNIEIGGRNLLANTGGNEAITIIGGEMSCTSVVSWTNDSGLLTLNCSGRDLEVYYRFMTPANSTNNLYNLEAGKTYTLSGKAKVSTTSGTMTTLEVRTQCNSPGKGWNGGAKSVITTTDVEDWLEFAATFTIEEAATGYYVSLQLYFKDSWDGTIQVKDLMLEQGNKASGWSPAPEDVRNSIDSAQNTANSAANRVGYAESLIQQLSDSIASMVRGESGGSLVKQDDNGLWYFDISTIEDNISQTANDLDEVEGLVRDADGKIDVLNSLTEALAAKTEYIRQYTDENDQPCLELGEGDSSFKLRITNTQIQFLDGTSVPAYVSNQKLMIERAEVKDEMLFGDFAWKKRDSGGMGIMWAGGENLLVNTHRYMAGTPIVMTSKNVDYHMDVFDNYYMLYTPSPLPANSKVWVQACSDGTWADEHKPSTQASQNIGLVGLFVYWCKSLAEAMCEDTETTNHYTYAYFLNGDRQTTGRYASQVNVPAVSGSTTEWYARIRLNIYPNGTREVTNKFWNIKMEAGESAGVWTPHASDESIW